MSDETLWGQQWETITATKLEGQGERKVTGARELYSDKSSALRERNTTTNSPAERKLAQNGHILTSVSYHPRAERT